MQHWTSGFHKPWSYLVNFLSIISKSHLRKAVWSCYWWIALRVRTGGAIKSEKGVVRPSLRRWEHCARGQCTLEFPPHFQYNLFTLFLYSSFRWKHTWFLPPLRHGVHKISSVTALYWFSICFLFMTCINNANLFAESKHVAILQGQKIVTQVHFLYVVFKMYFYVQV